MSNEYFLRSFQLNTPFNAYTDKLFSVLEVIFASFSSLRSCIAVLLQALYISSVNHLIQSDSIGQPDSPIFVKLSEITDTLLKNSGAYNRRAGTTALFCHSIWAFTPIIYFLIEIVRSKQLAELLNSDRFVCFLKKPEEASKKMSETINYLLTQVWESNLNHIQMIINGDENISDPYDNLGLNSSIIGANQTRSMSFRHSIFRFENQISYNDEADKQSIVLSTITNRLISRRKSYIESIIEESKNLLSRQLIIRQKQKHKNEIRLDYRNLYIQHLQSQVIKKISCNIKTPSELAIQYKHITKLIYDKSSIWPSNRLEDWRKTSRALWFYLYLATASLLFAMNQISTIIAINISIDALNTGGDVIELLKKNETTSQQYNGTTELGLTGRLSMIEQHVFVWFAIHWFLVPLNLLILSLIDQTRHLHYLRRKFEYFISKANEMKEFKAGQKYDFSKRQNSNTKEPLEFDFDKEALELYLSFQIFCKELNPTLKLARHILNQNVCFIISTVLPMLAYIKHIPTSHYRLYVTFYFGLMLIINCAFYACGSMNASFTRMSKLIWTILACVIEQDNVIFKDTKKFSSISNKSIKPNLRGEKVLEIAECTSTKDRATTTTKGSETTGRIVIDNSKMKFGDFKNGYIISSHTLSLWNKLANNHELLLEKFDCQVLGILKLEYTSIIKFNFWLVSLVLVFLTVQY